MIGAEWLNSNSTSLIKYLKYLKCLVPKSKWEWDKDVKEFELFILVRQSLEQDEGWQKNVVQGKALYCFRVNPLP